MSLKPQMLNEYKNVPTAFRDFKAVEWKVGNAVLDASKLSKGQVVKPFTAIFMNDSGLYELVKADTPETMKGALVTGATEVKIEDAETNEMVSAIRKAALIEKRCTGVTDNFKKAVQGRITFDV